MISTAVQPGWPRSRTYLPDGPQIRQERGFQPLPYPLNTLKRHGLDAPLTGRRGPQRLCAALPLGLRLVVERRMIEHPGNRVAGGLGERAKRCLCFLVAH